MSTNFSDLELLTPSPYNQAAQAGQDIRYHLTPESLSYLEGHLISGFLEQYPSQEGVVVFMTKSDSPYSDIARTEETRAFGGYDSSVAMLPYEDDSVFVYTVNLDEPVNDKGSRVAHIKRLVRARPFDLEVVVKSGTGLEVVDDRLFATELDEGATLDEIARYHGVEDFSRCINVTSNMAGEGVTPDRKNPYTLISYKAVFEIGNQAGATHLFAYVNKSAIRSLEKLGVRCDLLAGREFHLPVPNEPGQYDGDYVAACMPYDEANRAAFTSLSKEFPMRKLIADRHVDIFEL